MILRGRGYVDQLFTLARLLEGSCELGFLWAFVGVLRDYGKQDPFQRGIRPLYDCSRNCVSTFGNKSDTFPVGVGLRQGCTSSLALFVTFVADRILGAAARWRTSVECLPLEVFWARPSGRRPQGRPRTC